MAAASQISVSQANFVAMSVTNSVTSRVSPICVTKCFKISFRRRFYLTPIFWFRSQFYSNFSFYPEFSVYVLQSEKKFLLFFCFSLKEYKVIGDESSTANSREFFNNEFQVYLLLELSWFTLSSWSVVNWPFPTSYLLRGGNLKIKMNDWRSDNVYEKA